MCLPNLNQLFFPSEVIPNLLCIFSPNIFISLFSFQECKMLAVMHQDQQENQEDIFCVAYFSYPFTHETHFVCIASDMKESHWGWWQVLCFNKQWVCMESQTLCQIPRVACKEVSLRKTSFKGKNRGLAHFLELQFSVFLLFTSCWTDVSHMGKAGKKDNLPMQMKQNGQEKGARTVRLA